MSLGNVFGLCSPNAFVRRMSIDIINAWMRERIALSSLWILSYLSVSSASGRSDEVDADEEETECLRSVEDEDDEDALRMM